LGFCTYNISLIVAKGVFDDDFDELMISTCSNSCQLVPLLPIFISILFHHYKELMRCTKEAKEMLEVNVNNDNNIMMIEQEKPQET
jgi:hypothetical protein